MLFTSTSHFGFNSRAPWFSFSDMCCPEDLLNESASKMLHIRQIHKTLPQADFFIRNLKCNTLGYSTLIRDFFF